MIDAPAPRRRILYCTTNRFRTYNLQNYESLADAFDLRVVWVSPPPNDEPVPPELAARIRWWVVGDDSSRLTSRDVQRSARFFHIVERACRSCDLVIAPPAGAWKTRLVVAAAALHRVPVAIRSDVWREGDGLLRERAPARTHGVAARLNAMVTKRLEARAAGLLVNGVRGAEYLAARGVDPRRIYPFRRLHPDLARRELDAELVERVRRLKEGRIAFLYLGRVMQQKGVVPLVRAFRRILDAGRDALLFVVGGPITRNSGRGRVSVEYLDEAKQLAANEPRIVFVGQISPHQVHNYYAATDVFVHPHVATFDGQEVHEPWGNVITEAACMSMPIVVTDRIPAGFDLVEPGANGYILDASAVETALPSALSTFIDQPGLVKRFGARSREQYEQFADPAENVASLHRLIERCRPS